MPGGNAVTAGRTAPGTDRFEGRARLDWWANAGTNLAGDEVAVVVTAADGGWTAHGRLLGGGDNDGSHDGAAAAGGLAVLCGIDPVFTLRFDDGSTIAVVVRPAGEPGGFVLTEAAGDPR